MLAIDLSQIPTTEVFGDLLDPAALALVLGGIPEARRAEELEVSAIPAQMMPPEEPALRRFHIRHYLTQLRNRFSLQGRGVPRESLIRWMHVYMCRTVYSNMIWRIGFLVLGSMATVGNVAASSWRSVGLERERISQVTIAPSDFSRIYVGTSNGSQFWVEKFHFGGSF
jgi:hypothetical protein